MGGPASDGAFNTVGFDTGATRVVDHVPAEPWRVCRRIGVDCDAGRDLQTVIDEFLLQPLMCLGLAVSVLAREHDQGAQAGLWSSLV